MAGLRKSIYVDRQTQFYLRSLAVLDKGSNVSVLIQEGLRMLYWHEMEARGWAIPPQPMRPVLPRLHVRDGSDEHENE